MNMSPEQFVDFEEESKGENPYGRASDAKSVNV
jgi:hypothetical protein